MALTFLCDGCQTPLTVPPEARGKRARCPACGRACVVPEETGDLEETISHWIEEDVDELVSSRDEQIERRLKPAAGEEASPGSSESPPPPPPPPESAEHRQAKADSRGDSEQAPPRRRWPLRRQRMPSEPLPPPSRAEIESRMRMSAPTPQPAPSSQASQTSQAGRGEQAEGEYPQDLQPQGPRPHLVVRQVTPAGVHLAFEARWLAEEGFRASMPRQCIFTGEQAAEHLIARPAIWEDRLRGDREAGERLASHHECRELGQHTPRQIVRRMGRLEQLPHPFDQALPLYVSHACAHWQARCQSQDHQDGSITCQIIIPHPPTALAWLGRVNGVCGQDYRLLERDSSLQHGQAWQDLSETTRERITVWCTLRPREQFVGYYSDGDFGRRDAGLAGLVLTDQRLVFNKYHHRGELALDNNQLTIVAETDDRLANLSLHKPDGRRVRLVRLHRHDLDALAEHLQQGQANLTLSVR